MAKQHNPFERNVDRKPPEMNKRCMFARWKLVCPVRCQGIAETSAARKGHPPDVFDTRQVVPKETRIPIGPCLLLQRGWGGAVSALHVFPET